MARQRRCGGAAQRAAEGRRHLRNGTISSWSVGRCTTVMPVPERLDATSAHSTGESSTKINDERPRQISAASALMFRDFGSQLACRPGGRAQHSRESASLGAAGGHGGEEKTQP